MIASWLIALCGATVCSLVLAMLQGHLHAWHAVASLLIGALLGTICLYQQTTPRFKLTWPAILLFIAFGFFAFRAFCWLVFFDEDKIRILSPNNLGDLSLHLTYINYLARGAAFWPENPIFSGSPLHYPLGLDLFNALLTMLGLNVFRGLIWVGLLSALVTAVALYRWGGPFAMAGFLGNGGFAGYHFFQHFRFADYNDTVAWKSIPLAMFVTQRGLLYALPVGLVLLTHWRARWFEKSPPPERLSFGFELLLFATLPLFHLHTFLFLGTLVTIWAITNVNHCRKDALRLLAWAFLPATILTAYVVGLFTPGMSSSHHLIHIAVGWMQENQPFFQFWFINFGLLPLFVAGLIYLAFKNYRRDSSARTALAFVLPSTGIFLFACIVMLAPWAWDNTKIMIWSYLVVLPFIWQLVISQMSLVGRIASCFLLFFSGLISLVGGLDRSHQGYDLATRSELDGVRHATMSIKSDQTLAAYPTYNHPLLLCGLKLVAGYDGHLFSHGIDYQPQMTKLISIMQGEPNWRSEAHELHAHYLFWGEREEEHYPNSKKPWLKECSVLATGSWGAIYDLQATRGS